MFRERVEALMRRLQNSICAGLAAEDGHDFVSDIWSYERGSGGGDTRVLEGGLVIEKGGVNVSAIGGPALPAAAVEKLRLAEDTPFFATGVSLVIHPRSPHIPTVHMNVRYFEAGEAHWWFGGGIDLTPFYPRHAQVIRFHQTLRSTCARFDPAWYPRFKAACDRYFFLPHRNEARGVGGIFYDQLRGDRVRLLAFTEAVGDSFLPAYLPIVRENRELPWTEAERRFQLLRRGRYVEFNLLFDRGTKFGIESQGRSESILMSLPPEVRWAYNLQPEPGSAEARLLEALQPRDWAALDASQELS